MLAILLTILKIIGYILLGIIGLILALLLIVLFVPVRYKLAGESRKSEKHVNVQVSWLMHILHVGVRLAADKIIHIRIRIFGIPIIRKDLELFKKKTSSDKEYTDDELEALFAEEEEKEKSDTDSQEDAISVFDTDASDNQLPAIDSSDEPASAAETQQVQKRSDKKSPKESKKPTESKKSKEPKKPTESKKSDKETDGSQTFTQKAMKAKEAGTSKIKSIYDKMEAAREKAEEFWEFLNSGPFTRALAKVKKEVFLILRRILPRKARANITYGFENPETTGKMLGYLSILNAHIPATVVLKPDFDRTILYGDAWLRGYIQVIGILIPAVRLLLNKDIRYCYKQFRNKRRP